MTNREANEVMHLHPDEAERYLRSLDRDTAIDTADDLDWMAYTALGYARLARQIVRTDIDGGTA